MLPCPTRRSPCKLVYPGNVFELGADDEVTRVWISSQNVKAVAAKGFRVVHAASDYFYLVSVRPRGSCLAHGASLKDCGAGGWVGNFSTGNSWCDPFKTWQRVRRCIDLPWDCSKLEIGIVVHIRSDGESHKR